MGIVPQFPGSRRGFVPEQERPYTVDLAYQKAEQLLAAQAIQLDDFADLYNPELISEHKAQVQRLKAHFERRDTPESREAKKLATVLEAVLHDEINKHEWLGPNAIAVKPSDYDDYINGIDSIVEFKEPRETASYLALGIDVTYRSEIADKFERIKEEIKKGELAHIQYLKSSDGHSRGERKMVPRVVIGADYNTVSDIARAWYKNNPALRNDRLRYQILTEIFLQLEIFERYARKVNQPAVAEKYAESRSVVEKILASLPGRQGQEKFAQDAVFRGIQTELLTFE